MEATEPVPEPPPPAQDAVTAPTEQAEPTGEAVDEPKPAGEADEHAEQSELPGSGMILVARQPVEVLASPSSSAPALYGFPAGRPFRVIGREGGFAHIQDLRSSASGWIDEAALAQPPRDPAASTPSQPKPFSVGRNPTPPSAGPKPKTTQKDSRSLPTPKQPLNRIAGALAYLVGGVSSGGSSATATSLGLSRGEPRVRLFWVIRRRWDTD